VILSDNETKVDLLNNEPIAKAIVELLRKHSDHPITIGVHGDWGVGKSSVLEMVEGSLDADKRVLCLKFNGWRFQGFEDAKIALIEGIVTSLLEKRPLLTKASSAVKDVLHRIDLLKLAKRAGAKFKRGESNEENPVSRNRPAGMRVSRPCPGRDEERCSRQTCRTGSESRA
jgi:predicted KAP-like P-loop ATPase